MKDRSTFLYSEPDKDTPKPFVKAYAQCKTCVMWTNGGCLIHSKEIDIPGDASCNLSVMGPPSLEKRGEELPYVDPSESGLVYRQVRCENCRHFKANRCMFYDMLNRQLPQFFDLETKVNQYGCCTAQESSNG